MSRFLPPWVRRLVAPVLRSVLGRNVAYNFGGQALLMLLGFVAVKFQFSRLGADGFGIILFTMTATVFLTGLLELGVSATIVREVSARQGDRAYIVSLVRTAGTLYWIAFAALAAMLWLSAPWLVGHWIHLQRLDAATGVWMIRVLGLGALTVLPRSLYSNIFRGQQRMAINNAIDVTAIALQQVGLAAILMAGGGIRPSVEWLAGTYVLWLLTYLPVVARSATWLGLLPGVSLVVIRRNLKFASFMSLITTLAMVHTQADKVAISRLLPVAVLGWYGFASTVVLRATLLANAVVEAALPAFSSLAHAARHAELNLSYQRLQIGILLLTPTLFALIAFLSVPLFSVLFNDQVAQSLRLPVAVLCLGQYMNGTLAVPNIFSIAVGRPDISARLNLAAIVAVLPVTVLLVAKLGITGAALSWVWYHVFAYAYFVPRVSRECLKTPAIAWYRQTGKALGVIAGSYGVTWLLAIALHLETVPWLLTAYAIGSLVYVTGAGYAFGTEVQLVLRPHLMPGARSAA